ncbi:MAG TPA: LD-carboxypeptidase, partial [Spirochaetia bacterium]|nr:LD-carboxypeptidase [Spirochaetia bacterium]
YMLRNYGLQHAFDRASAIFFGRPKSYSDAEKGDLYRALKQVVGEEFGRPDLPIVANMDFGHTDPKVILPLGARLRVDSERREITVVEEFTRE